MVVMCRKHQSLDGALDGIHVHTENFFCLKLPGSTGKLWSRERLCCLPSLNPLQKIQETSSLVVHGEYRHHLIYKDKMFSLCLRKVRNGREQKHP